MTHLHDIADKSLPPIFAITIGMISDQIIAAAIGYIIGAGSVLLISRAWETHVRRRK